MSLNLMLFLFLIRILVFSLKFIFKSFISDYLLKSRVDLSDLSEFYRIRGFVCRKMTPFSRFWRLRSRSPLWWNAYGPPYSMQHTECIITTSKSHLKWLKFAFHIWTPFFCWTMIMKWESMNQDKIFSLSKK